MKVAAMIPLGGKTGQRKLCGKSLLDWTTEVAEESKLFDSIILMEEERSLDDLLVIAAKDNLNVALWCTLPITGPLRTAEDIRKAYKKVICKKYDCVVSVYHDPIYGWIEKAVGTVSGKLEPVCLYHYQRQEKPQLRKDWYLENGSIYFTKTIVIETFLTRLGGSVGLSKMPRERSFEVKDPVGWKICEMLLAERYEKK